MNACVNPDMNQWATKEVKLHVKVRFSINGLQYSQIITAKKSIKPETKLTQNSLNTTSYGILFLTSVSYSSSRRG